MQLQYNKNLYNLGFEISCNDTPGDVYFRVNYIFESDFHRFSEDFDGKVSDAIYIHKTQPIALIPPKEPYMNKAQVRKKIIKGKSHEVLRNKIINSEKLLKKVEGEIRSVFEDNSIHLRSKSNSSDEYINLEVEVQGISKELHLQGSGLLQIVEIFSSIEFFDSALNIILLDEPDSHIHTKLLLNLLEDLKQQSKNNQIFIITHNERFVDFSSQKGRLYFLDSKVKSLTKELKPLNEKLKLYVRKELGDIITGLDEFGSTNKLIMVEGKNDIKFWQNIYERYIEVYNLDSTMPYFLHLNGKDDIVKKVEHFLFISKQIKNIEKVMVIFDKDFATQELTSKTISNIKKVVNASDKKAMTYNGYCLESTFFSEIDKISKIISKMIGIEPDRIVEIIENHLDNLMNECLRIGSVKYEEYKVAFKSQQINREDLKTIQFEDFLKDVKGKKHYLLTKNEVDNLIMKINLEGSDASIDMRQILFYYLENLKDIELFTTHKNILDELHRL